VPLQGYSGAMVCQNGYYGRRPGGQQRAHSIPSQKYGAASRTPDGGRSQPL